jgi:hypothetical protein
MFLKLLSPNHESLQPKQYDAERVRKWLVEMYARDEFRWYFAQRDYALMKQMANGMEGKDYWTAFGRRMELLELLSRSRVEFELEAKKKRDK